MMSNSADLQPDFVRLFRVVKNSPPTRYDMLSRKALGIDLKHPTAKALRLWDGVSMNRTREQAARLSRESPWLGQFIAELRVPLDGSIRYELDNGRGGHCTIWGEPDVLRRLVVAVTPR
jgi:hypothetical protein